MKKILQKIGELISIFLICSLIALMIIFAIIGLSNTVREYSNKNKEIVLKLEAPIVVEVNLLDIFESYNIKDPEIVYCMAYLETGNFSSRLCTEYNNILGLYDSKRDEFMQFNSIYDCVAAYKEYIEYKRLDDESIFEFIDRIGYAEDTQYVNKVKVLQKQLFPNYGTID